MDFQSASNFSRLTDLWGTKTASWTRKMRFTLDGRQHGSYPETTFEEVIEANRHGTWTTDAETGLVKSAPKHLYDYPTNQAGERQSVNTSAFIRTNPEALVPDFVHSSSSGFVRVRDYNVFRSVAHDALLYSRVETVLGSEIADGDLKVGDRPDRTPKSGSRYWR